MYSDTPLFQYHPYAAILGLTAALSAGTAGIAWQRRHRTPAGLAFVWTMLAVTFYAVAAAAEAASVTQRSKIFFSSLEYVGSGSIIVLFVVLASQLSQRCQWLSPQAIRRLAAVPLLNVLLVATNHWHRLVWRDFTWSSRDPQVLIYEHGPGFTWVLFWSYLYIFGSIVLLVSAARRPTQLQRRQSVLIILGTLLPLLGALVYQFDLTPPGLNITPMSFLLTGTLYLLSLLHFRLFDLVPVARDMLIEHMSDGVLVVDYRQRIIDLNPAAKQLTGLTSACIGQPLNRVLPYWHQVISDLEHQGRQEITLQTEHQRYLDLTLVSLKDRWHRRSGQLLIFRDSTHHHRASLQLRQAKEAAEAAVQAKSDFLARMSHEIRTPMNSVMAMLSLLEKTSTQSDQQLYANIAQSSAESLLSLLNDILDFSKADSGKLQLEAVDFNLVEQLGNLAKSMVAKAHAKQLELVVDLRGIQHPQVNGDVIRLRQIVTNLVDNAIKFTADGEVVIRARLQELDKSLMLTASVQDTGIGIPANRLNSLFDPFTQVDVSTTRHYGGTGLGLAIAKTLCELMGGNIRVYSQPGQGSCFEFQLQLQPPQESSQPFPSDISNIAVLVVDDNDTHREVLCSQLRDWGVHVLAAPDATRAWALCEAHLLKRGSPPGQPFDLIFVDEQMPDLSGDELAHRLNADARLQDMPRVMMLSVGQVHQSQPSTNIQTSYLKPITPTDLLQALSWAANFKSAKGSPLSLPIPSPSTAIQWPERTQLLLVEDHPVNQRVVQHLLKQLGLSVDIASNGIEALQKLEQAPLDRPYTLVFMDCLMPVMDGYETSRRIRQGLAGEHHRQIPLIAMTASTIQGDREACLAAGMDDYLSKPINLKILAAALEKWLLEPEARPVIASEMTELA